MALFLSFSGISPAILIFFQPITPDRSKYLIAKYLSRDCLKSGVAVSFSSI